jgi:hypothetical protein
MQRQRNSADQWATRQEEFARGDFTIAEFGKLKGVCTNSFSLASTRAPRKKILDEFCTAKERKYGRQRSFSNKKSIL